MSEQVWVVTTTTADKESAQRLATELVELRLAACAQVSGPIDSTYFWQEKLESSQEWVCSLKTVASAYPRLEQAIRQRHGYDQPEILAVAVQAGSDGYLDWVRHGVVPADN